jgi:hypothetical protein
MKVRCGMVRLLTKVSLVNLSAAKTLIPFR